MMSVGEIAAAAGISARAVRYYEDRGLLESVLRGDNNYRFFDDRSLLRLREILRFKNLGFSLADIRSILELGDEGVKAFLKARITVVGQEIATLSTQKHHIEDLLSVCENLGANLAQTSMERSSVVEEIRGLIKRRLEQDFLFEKGKSTRQMERESWLSDSPEKRAFLEAIRSCVEFAKGKNIKIGPGRGSSPSSMMLVALGVSELSVNQDHLIPERLGLKAPDVHFDVEFARGQELVDYCRVQSDALKWGQINAFKMPLIDIIDDTVERSGLNISFDEIGDDHDDVLNPIRKGEVDLIFGLGFSAKAMVMGLYPYRKDYMDQSKLKEFLRGQEIRDFRDVANIFALWRPDHEEKISRINRYLQVKNGAEPGHASQYGLEGLLAPNFGLIIYHEDIVAIIKDRSDFTWLESAELRFDYFCSKPSELRRRFESGVDPGLASLIATEAPWTFCMPHTNAFTRFTKKTAILWSRCPKAYQQSVQNFEAEHLFCWDDIGIKGDGISLLQH